MDAIQLLEGLGDVPPAADATIEAVVDLILTAAFQERDPTTTVSPTMPRPIRRRRRVAFATTALAATTAVLAVLALVLSNGGTGRPTVRSSVSGSRHHAPSAMTARMIRLISSQSVSMTDSGTAVETETSSAGSPVQEPPSTTDVTFSGQNVNYLVTSNGNGAEGVEDRVVDGEVYLYVKGPDLQMRWYHDTAANAATSLSFPDPRTLLRAVSPSAGLENLGHESVGGVELTHLRASTPGSIGELGIPDVSDTVTSFEVWVDSDNVVRQMTISSSEGIGVTCPIGPHSPGISRTSLGPPNTINLNAETPNGTRVSTRGGVVCSTTTQGSTLEVQFANLGAPETVPAPTNAVNQEGLG